MRELSPAARLKLQELADRPAATFKQRIALLQFQIVVLLVLYVVVRIMLKIPWLGRGLSKVVKLSREGPLYKLGVWLCRRLARVTMGRRAYAKPSIAPAVRVKKRTATAIEVKVVAVRGRFGNADDVIVESRSDLCGNQTSTAHSMAWRCRFLTARRSQHGSVHPTHWLIPTQVPTTARGRH